MNIKSIFDLKVFRILFKIETEMLKEEVEALSKPFIIFPLNKCLMCGNSNSAELKQKRIYSFPEFYLKKGKPKLRLKDIFASLCKNEKIHSQEIIKKIETLKTISKFGEQDIIDELHNNNIELNLDKNVGWFKSWKMWLPDLIKKGYFSKWSSIERSIPTLFKLNYEYLFLNEQIGIEIFQHEKNKLSNELDALKKDYRNKLIIFDGKEISLLKYFEMYINGKEDAFIHYVNQL